MGRLTSTDGFTMAEVCAAVVGITVLACIFRPIRGFNKDSFHTFGDTYLEAQSEAIAASEDRDFISEDGRRVHFNADGNVQKAETLQFGKKGKKIVIELGGGRLVYR